MDKNTNISYPIGAFEDIREFDLKEFGNIDNIEYSIDLEMETRLAKLVSNRLMDAEQFTSNKEYDVALEVIKSALWLLEILNSNKSK